MQQMREFGRFLRRPILLTHHLRKQTTLDKNGFINLERLRGTSKIAQMARVVWTLDAPNVLDPQHKRLMIVKNNLAHDYKPLGMRITPDGITFDDPPEILTHTQSKINAAADFLLQYLRQGPQPAAQILEDGQSAGHTRSTLHRAKNQLQITTHRPANQTQWLWSLPQHP
jgi:hypothetical protein